MNLILAEHQLERYVKTVEESKRAAVDAVQLNSRKNVHVLATWPKQPPLPAAVTA